MRWRHYVPQEHANIKVGSVSTANRHNHYLHRFSLSALTGRPTLLQLHLHLSPFTILVTHPLTDWMIQSYSDNLLAGGSVRPLQCTIMSVCVCRYVCVCVYILYVYVCMYYVRVYVLMYALCIYMCIMYPCMYISCVCMYECMYVCMHYVCMYVLYMYVCTYCICMCVFMYVCTYVRMCISI